MRMSDEDDVRPGLLDRGLRLELVARRRGIAPRHARELDRRLLIGEDEIGPAGTDLEGRLEEEHESGTQLLIGEEERLERERGWVRDLRVRHARSLVLGRAARERHARKRRTEAVLVLGRDSREIRETKERETFDVDVSLRDDDRILELAPRLRGRDLLVSREKE